VTYKLAPGVSMTGGLEYADEDATPGSDLAGIAYMRLSF